MTDAIKPFLIVIYGKDGCDKCLRLKHEVRSVLKEENLGRYFDMDYHNLSTAEGMTAYALSETVNGQRIPALQIMKYSDKRKSYVKMPDTRPAVTDDEYGRVLMPVYLQLQTDYGTPEGAISQFALRELMALAREAS